MGFIACLEVVEKRKCPLSLSEFELRLLGLPICSLVATLCMMSFSKLLKLNIFRIQNLLQISDSFLVRHELIIQVSGAVVR